MRFRRDDPPRSSKQWRCKRTPSTSNVRRVCRREDGNRTKSIWRDEDQQDWDSVEQHSSVQDPGAQAQSKQKRTRDQQRPQKPKKRKTSANPILQHAISIIEKEIVKNLTFLQKIDIRNTNNATEALIIGKTPMPTAFSKQCH